MAMCLAEQEGHPVCKKLGVGLLVVMIWLKLCMSYSSTCQTATSIILSSNKIQNGDILVPANPGPPGKMAVKMETERERDDNVFSVREIVKCQ